MKRTDFLKTFVPAAIGSLLIKNAFSLPNKPIHTYQKMPPFLKPGDKVGVTCPASPSNTLRLHHCWETMESWGLKVQFGCTVGQTWEHFAGTDEERAEDLQQLLDDDGISAILFARGGYGVMRMLDKINWKKFVKKPKWLIGFSDITAFHCHIQTAFGIPTMHAVMAGGLRVSDDDASYCLKNCLFGKKQDYEVNGTPWNRPGTATAKLVGGNLSLIAAMQGCKDALQTDGKILLIEDVSEYKYTIDRMLVSLKRSGKLDKLAGLIVGGFTEMKTDKDETFTMSIEDIVLEKVKEFNYPVAFHFPIGHQNENVAVKLGCYYHLDVSKDKTVLSDYSFNNPLYKNAFQSQVPDTLKITMDTLKMPIRDTIPQIGIPK